MSDWTVSCGRVVTTAPALQQWPIDICLIVAEYATSMFVPWCTPQGYPRTGGQFHCIQLFCTRDGRLYATLADGAAVMVSRDGRVTTIDVGGGELVFASSQSDDLFVVDQTRSILSRWTPQQNKTSAFSEDKTSGGLVSLLKCPLSGACPRSTAWHGRLHVLHVDVQRELVYIARDTYDLVHEVEQLCFRSGADCAVVGKVCARFGDADGCFGLASAAASSPDGSILYILEQAKGYIHAIDSTLSEQDDAKRSGHFLYGWPVRHACSLGVDSTTGAVVVGTMRGRVEVFHSRHTQPSSYVLPGKCWQGQWIQVACGPDGQIFVGTSRISTIFHLV